MELDSVYNEEHLKLLNNLVQREEQERRSIASTSSDILKNLNISLDILPQKCQQIHQLAEKQVELGINPLDTTSITLLHSKQLSECLQNEYEILKLEQKNLELQMKIDRNNHFLEDLRRELKNSRSCLSEQNPSPDKIEDSIRELRQKVASYEDRYEQAKTKYSKMSVPDAILPKSLTTLAANLAALQAEALSLQQKAEDVRLAREAKETFNMLRRQTYHSKH